MTQRARQGGVWPLANTQSQGVIPERLCSPLLLAWLEVRGRTHSHVAQCSWKSVQVRGHVDQPCQEAKVGLLLKLREQFFIYVGWAGWAMAYSISRAHKLTTVFCAFRFAAPMRTSAAVWFATDRTWTRKVTTRDTTSD